MMNEWQKFKKTDKVKTGFIAGLILPLLVFSILYGGNRLIIYAKKLPFLLPLDTMMALSVVVNLFVFRWVVLKKAHDKTGKGMVAATVLYAVLYVFLFFVLNVQRYIPMF